LKNELEAAMAVVEIASTCQQRMLERRFQQINMDRRNDKILEA
jgi:hypothetical protein